MENNLNFSLHGGNRLRDWIINTEKTYNVIFDVSGNSINYYYNFFIMSGREKIDITYYTSQKYPLISFEEFLEKHEQTILNYIKGEKIESNSYSII